MPWTSKVSIESLEISADKYGEVTRLVARLDAGAVGRAPRDGRKDGEFAARGVERNQEADTLHFTVRGHPKVRVLPVNIHCVESVNCFSSTLL